MTLAPTVTRTPTSITITIPVRPFGKEVTGVDTRTGARFTEPETAHYMALIRDVVRLHLPPEPWTGPLAGEIVAYFAPPTSWSASKRAAALNDELRPDVSPDCDNISKIVWDALQVRRKWPRAVIANDGQITDLVVRKRYAAEDSITITLTRLDLGRGIAPTQPRLF
jgi:Holliday junction resolvase RusA-like endonuclease